MSGSSNNQDGKAGSMVVCCSHGLSDPLVDHLMLDYLFRLQERTPMREVLLFTEEAAGSVHSAESLDRLRVNGITWVPLKYDLGGRQWLQKLRSMWTMFRRTWSFSRGKKGTWLLGYLAFGGAYAALLGLFGLGRNVTICFEPHSRYMVELGIWKEGGLRHRVVRWLEKFQVVRAAAVLIPTRAGMDLARSWQAPGELILQGITIDVSRSSYDPMARERFRSEHGIGKDLVVAYVGKFGGIYYEVADYLTFAARLLDTEQRARFLVIAGQAQLQEISAHPAFEALSGRFILHPPVPPERLHEVLSAADLGVIAVPPTPSQVFRTPVKTAHYWAAGLPIVVPDGISDDPEIARAERVGIVVKGLPNMDVDRFMSDLRALRASGVEDLRKRCMAAAIQYRDTKRMVEHLHELLK